MSAESIESRLAAVEKELARLWEKVEGGKGGSWRDIIGTFANDPDYEEAMKYGREYRESTRPKLKQKKKR